MLNSLFRGKQRYATLRPKETDSRVGIPDGLWTKCEGCSQIVYNKELKKNLMVCPKCGHLFRMPALDRVRQLMDDGTFVQFDDGVVFANPLQFPDYESRIERARKESGLDSAAVTGTGMLDGHRVVLVCMDFAFVGASMGSMEGEKIAYAMEQSLELRVPLVIVATSGGARMHEGIISLMQMAKTSAVLSRLDAAGILYISVLTSPTYGGVSASFGWLGDLVIAEAHASLGFAGRRSIEQTGEKLPDGFQTSEFMLEHGLIDMIVDRKTLKQTLSLILDLHSVPKIQPPVSEPSSSAQAPLEATMGEEAIANGH